MPVTSGNSWVGLPQTALKGVSGVILTLNNERGRLIGLITINAVAGNDAPPRLLGRRAHRIMNLRLDGYTLRLVVIRPGDGLRGERPPA